MGYLNKKEKMFLEFVAIALLRQKVVKMYHDVDNDEYGRTIHQVLNVQDTIFAENMGELMEEILKNKDYEKFLIDKLYNHGIVCDDEFLSYVIPGLTGIINEKDLIRNKSFEDCVRVAAKRNINLKKHEKDIRRRNFKVIKC